MAGHRGVRAQWPLLPQLKHVESAAGHLFLSWFFFLQQWQASLVGVGDLAFFCFCFISRLYDDITRMAGEGEAIADAVCLAVSKA